MKIFLGRLILIVIACAFSSCSAMKLARQYADWYIESEVDDAFALNSAQEDHISQKIDEHLKWFDKSFSIEIANYADEVHSKTQTDLSPENLKILFQTYEGLRVKLMDRIAPEVGYIFSNMDDKQLKNFKEYLEESNEELEEKLNETDTEFREDVLEDRYDNLEEWFGNISIDQRNQINKFWPIEKKTHQRWLHYRKLRQGKIFQLASSKKSAKEVEETIKQWGREPNKMYPDDIAKERKAREKQTSDYVVKIYAAMNKEQKKFFHNRLKKLSADFREFSK